jgi:hypothetical protein
MRRLDSFEHILAELHRQEDEFLRAREWLYRQSIDAGPCLQVTNPRSGDYQNQGQAARS